MGLDMYLYGVNFKRSKEGNEVIKRQIIKTEEIYWRKANHIHKWFVDNVQYGEDDCNFYMVSVENLIKLRDLCHFVLINKNQAGEVLPTQSGFFFGNTDYDECYFNECARTVDEINRILNDEKDYDCFEYNSSW